MRAPLGHLMAVAVAAFIAATLGGVGAGQVKVPAVAVDGDDIGGVVTGPKGPEAGAWVIAETTGLSTRMIKSVVTDDQGRYLIPDLPKAMYDEYSSSAASAARIPRATTSKKTEQSPTTPMNPSSSPMMAETKSVCASGKYKTWRPLPRPRPVTSPEPKLITD